eukprot:scaffold89463_cov71-Cyclotella_meneghiniana.AAC.4
MSFKLRDGRESAADSGKYQGGKSKSRTLPDTKKPSLLSQNNFRLAELRSASARACQERAVKKAPPYL